MTKPSEKIEQSTIDSSYHAVRAGTAAFYPQTRALIAMGGTEAVQFLNGLVTNDVAKLEDGAQMRAAFPNAQGRLIALVRVARQGDKFMFETEEATHQAVFDTLHRFTYAGDFTVEDLSEDHRCYSTFGKDFLPATRPQVEFDSPGGVDHFVHVHDVDDFVAELENIDAVQISDAAYEVLRIENGIPRYGVDMDASTIVPEIGISDVISYQKGCYIGQEIIARIHFRGHVAKRLTGLVFGDEAAAPLVELTTPDGKKAGRLTSSVFSPKLGRAIALGYVRFEHLTAGTVLQADGRECVVTDLPFIS